MNQPFRLPPQPREWIDRQRLLRFSFEGQPYTAYAGDTFSSALAAHGVRVLGRSFKYHRPRGIYSLANLDVNVLLEDDERTNLRGDVTPVWDGAAVRAVNTRGGVLRDTLRLADSFGAFMPVGFYYKTFYRPRRFFPLWERMLRRVAGLGTVDKRRHPRRSANDFAHTELLVVGAGPAGISAALAAARHGVRVCLVDEQPTPGGSLLYQHASDQDAQKLLDGLIAQLAAEPLVCCRLGTVAAGYYADHYVALVDGVRLTRLRTRCTVLATGAYEQPAVFGNNDLPGVMLATAAQRLIHQYAVRPGRRAVLLTANSEGYAAARDLLRAGVELAAVVDLRPEGDQSQAALELAQQRVSLLVGHMVLAALPDRHKLGVQAVQVAPLRHGRPDPAELKTIECDLLAMSVGWAPADGLLCQAGGKSRYSEGLRQFVPEAAPPGLFVAGRLAGIFDLSEQMASGRRAGLQAAAYLGRDTGELPPPVPSAGPPHNHDWPVALDGAPRPREAKAFVDLDEDVHFRDLVHAVQEGFDHVELLKRFSTFGMGPSQGKLANSNCIRILARLKQQPVGETGAPTARPFVHPVPLGQLAGRGFHPQRQTSLHEWHAAAGAQWIPAGDWLRPAWYGQNGSTRDEAIAAEVRAVRERVGLIDVGTLGKLEVQGRDAAELLERIYTGRFARMRPGTTRYGLMCDESGVVIDDGVVARLDDDRFYATTTTTNSSAVYRELLRWALIWGLDVSIVNATGHRGAINLAGPFAREILREVSTMDTSEQAFPYLAVREVEVLGIPARVLRTGFVGEVAYELHVPALHTLSVWEHLMAAGRRYGLRPFGVEAQRVLRLEKGHLIIGQDTDGLTTPYEAGLETLLKMDKPFFVGQRSLQIVGRKPLTRRLVGFALAADGTGPVPQECHLVIDAGEIAGRVTSIAYSPTLGRTIGLAYVRPRQAVPGMRFHVRVQDGTLVPAEVVPLPFYDPDHSRQRI
jgi:sarcosine oxidase subunit alpha